MQNKQSKIRNFRKSSSAHLITHNHFVSLHRKYSVTLAIAGPA